jgi:MoaA/NifB/PqqE/SkfB family radical SAM enzyme
MWVLKLNLAITAWNNGFKSDSNKKYISNYIHKFETYKLLALKYRLDQSYPENFITVESLDSDKFEYPSEISKGTALPIFIDVNTTNRCNAACVMCPPSLLIENKSQKRDPLFMFDKDKLNSILDSEDVKSIHFVGAYAEPLLNKDIYDLIRISSDRGVFTAITSNAQLLDSAAALKLIENGLKMLSISLHGSSKLVAESIMGRSNFETTITNLESMSNLKKELNTTLPEIHINFVGMVNNIQDLAGVITLADKIGAPVVNCFHLLDGESVVDSSLSLTTNPSLARYHIPNAMKLASELGIRLYVSPEYLDLINSY